MRRRELADELIAHVMAIPGVEERRSRFGDHPAWCVGSREFLHFEGSHAVDVRLTNKEIRRSLVSLASDSRISLRQSLGDWVEVAFPRRRDIEFVMALVKIAVEANRRTPRRGQ